MEFDVGFKDINLLGHHDSQLWSPLREITRLGRVSYKNAMVSSLV